MTTTETKLIKITPDEGKFLNKADWDTELSKTAVAVGLNVGVDAKVVNSTFKDCYTPIFVNVDGKDVTLTDIDFNSGINFDLVISANNLSGLTLVKDAAYDKANLDFTNTEKPANDAGIQAIRDKFPELTVRPELPEAAE